MGHPNERGALRRDSLGEWTGAFTWGRPTQKIAFTDTAANTAITLDGYDFLIISEQDCHITFGTTRMPLATVSDFYLPANTYLPVYVALSFFQDATSGDEETHYISIVRDSANGDLYLTNYLPVPGTSEIGPATSTSTTTTTTSTTTTSTSTTSTTT